MPTAKASDLPEAPAPIRPFVTPRNTIRARLAQAYRRAGIAGLARLALPVLHILLEKLLVEAQSRLPFAYRRWQIEFENNQADTLVSTAAAKRVAFVYLYSIEKNIPDLIRQTPSGSLAVFNSTQNVSEAPDARFFAADHDGQFLRWCCDLAASEKIEWLVFTWSHAIHDARLIPALLAQDTNIDCVYWDEDHLGAYGKRRDPFFKPAWSPEMWLSIDLLDTIALRTRVLSKAMPQSSNAGFKAWLAGANQPLHIAQVWTHRLPAPAADQQSRLAKHAHSVSAYLANLGLGGINIQIESEGVLKTTWAVRVERVSIIIPTRNNLDYLQRCLESLLQKTDEADYEVILVDNHSTDKGILDYYPLLLHLHKNVRILPYNEPFNFSQACNLGAAAATGSLLLFLNNDVEIIEPGWLEEMVRLAQLPGVGIVGSRLFYPDGRLQHAGIVVGMTGHANHVGIHEHLWKNSPYGPVNARRNCSAVTGACMLVRADLFQAIHGFKEDYHLVFNDVEICLRAIQAGWRVVLTPYANLIHYEGRSRARYIPPEDILLAGQDAARWVELGDPYYSPHLSLAVTRPVFRSRIEMPALRRMQRITTILSGDAR